MTKRILTSCMAAAALLAFAAADGYADVSRSGAPFLKIAPGARAVGMGESFVGVADDATTTHYNPAGLGSQPLGTSWQTLSIPSELRPLRQVAAVRVRGGGTISSYDLWAITSRGLARFDQSNWYFEETYRTRPDQTVAQMAKTHSGITDEVRLAEVVRKIAETNNTKSFAATEGLAASIRAAIPSDYKDSAAFRELLDSLTMLYDQCRLNWENIAYVEKTLADGMGDNTLTKSETDKLLFALERVRNRFIPEDIRIPLSIWFEGEPTMLTSRGDGIIFLTTAGLYSLVGSEWRKVSFEDSSLAEGELPSVASMSTIGGVAFVGTDHGVWRVDGSKASKVKSIHSLPSDRVTAIGGNTPSDMYAIASDHLWHFNGTDWSTTRDYTVVIDDTIDRIIDKLSLYGTTREREELRAAIFAANKAISPTMTTVDSAAVQPTKETPDNLFARIIQAGKVIQVPCAPTLKGDMTTIRTVGTQKLFLGGEFGVAYLNSGRWSLPGYTDVSVSEGQTIESILSTVNRPASISEQEMKSRFSVMNDVGEGQPMAGTKVKVFRHAAACQTLEIVRFEGKHFFATSDGVIEYDGVSWRRSEFAGIGNERIFAIISDDEGFQVVSEKTIAHFVPARREITAMYTPLLGNLGVTDLNYNYFSIVTPIAGLGTFGIGTTMLSYGEIIKTGEEPGQIQGSFFPYEFSLNVNYGGMIGRKLAGGIGFRLVYSHLSDLGAGAEIGAGTATGVALSGGLLYQMKPNLRLGFSARNFGPDISYIDAAQSDPLPRSIALGFGWWPKKTEDWRVLVTGQAEKEMVAIGDGFKKELEQVVVGGGAEIVYLGTIAGRIGYRYDGEEFTNSYMTFGVGVYLMSEKFRGDFSFIPSSKNGAQDNTPKFSLAYAWF